MSTALGRLFRLARPAGLPISRQLHFVVSGPTPLRITASSPLIVLRTKATAAGSTASQAKSASTRKASTGTTVKTSARKPPAKKARVKSSAKKAAPKKTALKKKAKKVALKKKAAPKKKKAVLKTEEQKLKQTVREKKAVILDPPPTGHITAYNIFLSDSLKGSGARTLIGPEVGKQWSSLPESEKSRYADIARARCDERKAAYSKWIELYTPAEIYQANLARRWLKKHNIKRVNTNPIKDHRAPKRPYNAYMHFVVDHRSSFPGDSATEKSRAAGKQWNELSENEKKPYKELALQAREKYDAINPLHA